jgi:hypothetical protein
MVGLSVQRSPSQDPLPSPHSIGGTPSETPSRDWTRLFTGRPANESLLTPPPPRNICYEVLVYTTYTVVAISAITSVVFLGLAAGDSHQSASERQASYLLSITCAVPPFATWVYHFVKRPPFQDPMSPNRTLLV